MCSLDYCDKPSAWEGSLCRGHLSQQARGTELKPLRTMRPKGTGWYNEDGYHSSMIEGRKMFTHRRVMQESLGRELLPTETVHHLNGVRTDNRLENLELWSTSQPSGQRVVDKVQWAKEILEVYEPCTSRTEAVLA